MTQFSSNIQDTSPSHNCWHLTISKKKNLLIALAVVALISGLIANGGLFSILGNASFALSAVGYACFTLCIVLSKICHKPKKVLMLQDHLLETELSIEEDTTPNLSDIEPQNAEPNQFELELSNDEKTRILPLEDSNSSSSTNGILISFYTGQGKDIHGRTFSEILEWDNDQLEEVHNFIQWLFPLFEPSRFYEQAPLLDKETLDILKNSPAAQKNLERAYRRMVAFYGFRYKKSRDISCGLKKGKKHLERIENLTTNTHNYARLSRIFGCLCLMNRHDLVGALFNELRKLHVSRPEDHALKSAYGFWRANIDSPLLIKLDAEFLGSV